MIRMGPYKVTVHVILENGMSYTSHGDDVAEAAGRAVEWAWRESTVPEDIRAGGRSVEFRGVVQVGFRT